jgi:RNA polymerase sigma-70 factor, ECF subfamily
MPSPFHQTRSRQALASPEGSAPELDVGTLYSQHADAVARWAGRLAGPTLDIEDLVHEVFLVACRRLREFRGDAKVTTWLYEITVRVVQDRRRRHNRWHWFSGGGRGGRPEAPSGDAVARAESEQPSALDLLERKQAGATLYEVLDALPEKYRTAIILFELEGMSGQEIAVVTKTSLSNVWIRLFRGRQLFVKRLSSRIAREER